MVESFLLNEIANSYIETAKRDQFNGTVASALLKIEPNPDRLRADLSALIQSGQISAVFSRFNVNMHIKRFPDASTEEQLGALSDEALTNFCLYPSGDVVQQRVDLSAWQDRPFSRALLLAEPQLSFRAFDMGALERYVGDPRYLVHFADYMGTMSIANDSFEDNQYPERDKVSLQTFGLGFDEQRNPYVVVYLRYLASLSPEHQQYWNSYLTDADVRLSAPYFQSSIQGEFWKNRSVRYAIFEEMRLIRALTEAIWGRSLFRVPSEGEVPIGLTSFLRPTAENFNRFVLALDKLLSESIDIKFFEGKVPLEAESARPDGRIIVQSKGTLTLLEEWLQKEIIWSDQKAFRETIIQPLRKVRRLRQAPAHAFISDAFSASYRRERKEILWNVLNSLSNVRSTFARHPKGRGVQIPEWLDTDGIDVF